MSTVGAAGGAGGQPYRNSLAYFAAHFEFDGSPSHGVTVPSLRCCAKLWHVASSVPSCVLQLSTRVRDAN